MFQSVVRVNVCSIQPCGANGVRVLALQCGARRDAWGDERVGSSVLAKGLPLATTAVDRQVALHLYAIIICTGGRSVKFVRMGRR
jgi:hypothetical protein